MKSTAIVGGMTLISRILGFLRDMVIAYTFGASASTDAFLVAFKIPNFMRRLFAEGAFSQAFVPIFSEYKTQCDHATVKNLVDQVAGTLGGVLVFVTVAGIILAPLLVLLFAPGFIQHETKFALTVDMLRITFPYLPFIALTALAGGILNTYGKFAIPALTPVFLNICMIAGALWLSPHLTEPVMALVWAVLLAGVIQLAFQFPFLNQLNLLPRPRFNWQDEGVKRVVYLMLPALLGVSVSQINLLVDTLMASFLMTGSVSWLYYADRLMELPVALFGIALGTVTLPSLSKLAARQEMQNYSNMLDWSLRWMFLIVIPCTVGLVILAQPILVTLFYSGQFTEKDVIMTSYSLIAYGVGLIGFVSIKVLAPGFYARQNTRTPVRIAVIAMVTNIVLNLALIIPLKHAGLALSTSLAALLNGGLLYYTLRQQGIFRARAGWGLLLIRVGFANVCMAGLLWWGSGSLAEWLNITRLERATELLGWIVASILVYFTCLLLFGFRWHHLNLKHE